MAFTRLFKRLGNLIFVPFAFLVSIPSLLPAQSIYEQVGQLPVTAYSAEEYGGDPLVLAAIQSEERLMYFGTRTGMHEYDGVSWRFLFKRNDLKVIRSFTKDPTGRIFYAGDDFGYLEVDAKGETRAVSLFHLLPEELRSGFMTLQIYFLKGSILLRTLNNHIIKLELEEDFTLKSLKTWEAETVFGISFVLDNEFYIRQLEKGLYRLEGEDLKLIPNTEIFRTESLSVMLPYFGGNGQSILMGAQSSGFYLFEEGVLKKFPTEVDVLIKEGKRLYCAISHQGNYVLGLIGGGIVTMNSKGEILKRIGTDQGLPSDVVYSIYLDENKGLWATTEDGMARISIDSPILSYGKDLGINSAVLSIQKKGDNFFLGTNTGLLKFNSSKINFQTVTEIGNPQVFDITIDGEDLIVPGRKLHIIRDGKAIVLDGPNDNSISNTVLIPKNNPNLMMVGSSSGLLIYQRGLSKEFPWEYKGKAPNIGRIGSYLFEGKNGTVFTGAAGIFYALRIQESELMASVAQSIKSKVFEFSLSDTYSLVDGELYVKNAQGMQKYSEKEEKFLPTDDFKAVEEDIIDFNQDKAGTIWYESLDRKKYILKRDATGKFVRDDRPNSITPYLSTVDYIDEDSIFWFGTPKGLISYDPKKDNQTDKEFFTLIRRIETKTDTVPLPQYGRNKGIAPAEMKDNSYRFEFAAPYFEDEKKTKYQTYLEGFDADWVDWNDNKFKEYTNLPAGTYTFRARAMAFTGRISEEASYSFVVLPPWYATWWAYIFYAFVISGAITGIVKWRSRKLKAENRILEERVNERTAALEKSLTELKATQAQLIQSEKMASLGELTAGIAHEIQNPLNFVNNFSEVSAELVEEILEARGERREAREEKREMRSESLASIDKEEKSEELEDELLEDIKKNLEKIKHHGKRADAIVKGMLAHSRTNSGEKIPTDINALAEEYLRLSYHGLRAKDKSFYAEFKTNFDPNLPKVNVVPQEIGRVLLNLINNAFQACAEYQQGTYDERSRSAVNQPLITVSTKNLGDKIEISVKDNGPGIPKVIKDKIFQPFFTTKPTGQGTGLGLSLSYDIVKAHGGELKVDTREGEGSEFIIQLPIV